MKDNEECQASGEGAVSLTPKFILMLEKQYDERLAACKREIEQLTEDNATRRNAMTIKYKKVKEIKNDTKNCKKVFQAKEETLACLRESQKHLSDYVKMKEDEANKYLQETVEFRIDQQKRHTEVENKWNSFKAKYETLPLARLRSVEKTAMMNENINLMLMKVKRDDINRIVAQRAKIQNQRRNNEIVECARLFGQAKSEDLKMRQALEKEKILRDKLRQQESQIAELKKRQSEQLPLSGRHRVPGNYIGRKHKAQRRCLPMPSFDLNLDQLHIGSSTQPIPTLVTKDLDTLSISSSIIDNLFETNKSTETPEVIGYDAAMLVDQQNPNSNEEQDLDNQNPQHEGVETFEEDSPTDGNINLKVVETCNQPTNKERDLIVAETDERGAEALNIVDPKTTGERSSFPTKSNSKKDLEIGEPEIKRPRITKIEKVERNVMLHKLNDPKTPKDAPDSLAGYFTASESVVPSVDFSWKPGALSRFSSFTGSQKDPDLMSNFGSEASMLTEGMMKRFNTSFSSELRAMDEPKGLGDNKRPEYEPSQNTETPFQLAQASTAPAFLNLAKNFFDTLF